ncbi:PIN domain-containing protein [Candidatus Poribacteria bacterium]|nr:PIN domain-containing protein [Candidatus Poribacteria bacterium]
MREVFADTAGWANFFIRTEPYHRKAVELMRRWRQQGRRIVTTNYVLSELVALFTSPLRLPRHLLVRYIETIKNASYVGIIHVDKELDTAAWTLLKERLDKEWTLVDCASFVMMQQRGITEAFTTDHHFEQAGFVRLLKL